MNSATQSFAHVTRKLRGHPASYGAGVKLTRVIGSSELDSLDPLMTAPRYQEFAPARIPVAQPAAGVAVKVIAGAVDGVRGPIAQPHGQRGAEERQRRHAREGIGNDRRRDCMRRK